MANIQQSLNQALYSASKLKFGKEISKAATKINSLEDQRIKEAEERQNYYEAEAKKEGFSSAQSKHDIQLAADRAANELRKNDPNFGFYTREGVQTAFGEPAPSERFVIGNLEESFQLNGPVPSSLKRIGELRNQRQETNNRRQFLENPEMEEMDNGK